MKGGRRFGKEGTVNELWVGIGQEVQRVKPKLLRKALDCSRTVEALKLVKHLGLDYNKEGAKSETLVSFMLAQRWRR